MEFLHWYEQLPLPLLPEHSSMSLQFFDLHSYQKVQTEVNVGLYQSMDKKIPTEKYLSTYHYILK